MFTNIQRKVILAIAVSVITTVTYNTNPLESSFEQENGTQPNETDYVNFHSNIEQIKGHIE